ncbi:MAG: ribosomal RNA small subunit methyltransferase A [Candidatus Omnitrophica bacterium]|nr:ribosomal RNA small subunit methyltransferase A [Candidatus Omnitrophota bacterium]
MHTKSELLEVLRANRLRLKKRLGQHYLVDPRVVERLLRLCEISDEDTVVEVGAGLGALTEGLASAAKQVIAVELDPTICALLKTRLASRPNVRIACQDILTFPWADCPANKVVGAIPYQITSPLLIKLCEQAALVREVWLGLQHEVAQRLDARPGTKAYGRLTILVQYHFDVKRLMAIPRSAFFPQPKVDSSWVRLTARSTPTVVIHDEPLLFDLVRAAFSQRRKMLLNCLRHLSQMPLEREEAASALHLAGLRDGIRGEELSLEAFARLANVITSMQSNG